MSPSCSAPTCRSDPLAEQTPDDETRQWAITAARAADSKQATDVVVLEVAEVLALCGWFVIASAGNERLVKAICDEVEQQVHLAGGPEAEADRGPAGPPVGADGLRRRRRPRLPAGAAGLLRPRAPLG